MDKTPTKSALKAYMSVLRTIAKSNKKDRATLKGVAVREGRIEATNVKILAYMDFGGWATPGIYDLTTLDTLTLNLDADLTAYKARDINDWVVWPKTEHDWHIDLDTETQGGSLGEVLIRAAKLASDDPYRPALTQVHIEWGEVMASDGYRAITSGKVPGLEERSFPINNTLLNLFAKVAKYGSWRLSLEQYLATTYIKLSNGVFTLLEPVDFEGKFPDLRGLINAHLTTTRRITLSMPDLKTAMTKQNCMLRIRENGDLYLGELEYGRTSNFRPLPIRAEIEDLDHTFAETDYREIIMPMATSECGLIDLNLHLLKTFDTRKDGTITLYTRTGDNFISISR